MTKLPIDRKGGTALTYVTGIVTGWLTEAAKTHGFTTTANPLWCIGAGCLAAVAMATLLAWITE